MPSRATDAAREPHDPPQVRSAVTGAGGGMVIFDESSARLEWLEGESVLKKTVHGFVSSEVLRRLYEAASQAMLRYRPTKILSDNRRLTPTARADLEWIEREFLPAAARAGWRYWAVLAPETAMGAMSARRWVKLYQQAGIEYREFQREEDALEWLRGLSDHAFTE